MRSSYQDPTFDETRPDLGPVTQESIIGWLRRGGSFTMPPLKRERKSQSHRVRSRALALLPVAIAGVVAGWFLRRFALTASLASCEPLQDTETTTRRLLDHYWFISGAPDPRCSDDELATLRNVHGSDFEVVQMTGLVAA